jgi:HAD superfamily hydrolase (TIGR01662 family)
MPYDPDTDLMPAIVLDFDGTVRHARPGEEFINGPDDVRLYSGVMEKLNWYKSIGFLVLGLTNQGGVAWDYKSEEDVEREVARMKEICEERGQDWPFHDWYASYCMEGARNGRYSARSLGRKPMPGGLFLMERRVWQIKKCRVDWSKSFLVGDQMTDYECAKRAEIGFMHAQVLKRSEKPPKARGEEALGMEGIVDPTDSDLSWSALEDRYLP